MKDVQTVYGYLELWIYESFLLSSLPPVMRGGPWLRLSLLLDSRHHSQ